MAIIKDLLLQILAIAQYPNDTEQFIKNFEAYNQLEAIIAVVKTLPEETQELIKSFGDDHTQIIKYIPEDAFRDEYLRVTNTELAKLLETITPTLTLLQKQKISQLFGQS